MPVDVFACGVLILLPTVKKIHIFSALWTTCYYWFRTTKRNTAGSHPHEFLWSGPPCGPPCGPRLHESLQAKTFGSKEGSTCEALAGILQQTTSSPQGPKFHSTSGPQAPECPRVMAAPVYFAKFWGRSYCGDLLFYVLVVGVLKFCIQSHGYLQVRGKKVKTKTNVFL